MNLLLILVIAILAWLVIKPAWKEKLPRVAVPKGIGETAGRWQEGSRRWLAAQRPFWKKKPAPGVQLLNWVRSEAFSAAAGLTELQITELAELRGWIASLSAAEVEMLARECSAFSKAEQIHLSWLLDEPCGGDLQRALSGLVLFYGLAVRERSGARPSIMLRTWQDAPLAKSNREFGKQLYARLVDDGLIVIPADLLLAPEKERLVHQVGAIQGLIGKDRTALLPIVAKVLDMRRTAKPIRRAVTGQIVPAPTTPEQQSVVI